MKQTSSKPVREGRVEGLTKFLDAMLEDYKVKTTINDVLKSWGEKEEPFIREYAEQLYDLIMGIVEIELKRKDSNL